MRKLVKFRIPSEEKKKTKTKEKTKKLGRLRD